MDITLHRAGSCTSLAWFITGELTTRQITFPALIAHLRHDTLGTILMDTGYGQPLADSRSWNIRIFRRLVPFTLPTTNLLGSPDLIFLTHYHPDHIGNLRNAPTVPIIASAHGYEALLRLSPWQQSRAAFYPELLPADFASRLRPIESFPTLEIPPFGACYDIAGDNTIFAVPLPGHALGHYGLLLPEEKAFFIADAAWVVENWRNLALPSPPGRTPIADFTAFEQTLRHIQSFHRNHRDLSIIPSHCERSIAAFESR
jgi:glyoxylase-like metal-dependent hydrolase (beta-lactamase superfamily II)